MNTHTHREKESERMAARVNGKIYTVSVITGNQLRADG